MRCSQCGTDCKAGTAFCARCGNPLPPEPVDFNDMTEVRPAAFPAEFQAATRTPPMSSFAPDSPDLQRNGAAESSPSPSSPAAEESTLKERMPSGEQPYDDNAFRQEQSYGKPAEAATPAEQPVSQDTGRYHAPSPDVYAPYSVQRAEAPRSAPGYADSESSRFSSSANQKAAIDPEMPRYVPYGASAPRPSPRPQHSLYRFEHEDSEETEEREENGKSPVYVQEAPRPLSAKQFFGIEILSLIPVINVIALCVMALSSRGNPNRTRLAQAKLALMLFLSALALLGAATVLFLLANGVIDGIYLGRWTY